MYEHAGLPRPTSMMRNRYSTADDCWTNTLRSRRKSARVLLLATFYIGESVSAFGRRMTR